MITATYFGEITELDSRAVFYSDEEDDFEEPDESELAIKTTPKLKSLEPSTHEKIRSGIQLNFVRVASGLNLKFTNCIMSLSSSSQFKNYKLGDMNSLPFLGYLDSVGKVFAYPTGVEVQRGDTSAQEYTLWLLFDSSHPYIVGHEVGYFVEALREVLHNEFNINNASQNFLILSQQFSNSDQLEYLSNFNNPTMKLPFFGRPILPPSLIKNQFESSLFEQFTLSMKAAFVICLPNPKSFWFDKTKNWPTVPNDIIEHKLNDDNLEKTLIFT